MEKLLILGAGIYQVPLIQTAQRMGLEALVVTPDGPYPGIPLADQWYNADTRDQERILKIAQAEGISGICTSGTDVAMKSIGYVCDNLGLSGVSYQAACRATDKMLMKQAFHDSHVATSAFKVVRSEDEARNAAFELGLPVMLKITDSSGSRGICKVSRLEEIPEAYRTITAATSLDYVLVEKFVEGYEVGVDGFIGPDGTPAVVLPHGKFMYKAPSTTVPAGHYFPLDESPLVLETLSHEVAKAAKALGLCNCAFNSDVFICEDGVSIIEMGARTGATCIPELMSIHKGYDWYEKTIRAALGQSVSFESNVQVPCMAKLLVSAEDMVIGGIDEAALDALREKATIQLDVKAGDAIHAMRNGTDRFGHVIMQTESEAELDDVINRVKDCISAA